MPQITCPNCGMTINLENRKEIDLDLIKHATQRGPTTFTELLHITRLPRKTLSIRLKELLEQGALVKIEGTYSLNGNVEFKNNGGHFMTGFSRVLNDRRLRTGLMLAALLLCSTASGYVLAMFLATEQTPINQTPPRQLKGEFTMAIKVNNVEDLWAWQVVVTFKGDELQALSTSPGPFFGVSFPFFMNASDFGKDTILIGGSLSGADSGKSGSGILATVAFGYYVDNYSIPEIVPSKGGFMTLLLDSKDYSIPIGPETLALEP